MLYFELNDTGAPQSFVYGAVGVLLRARLYDPNGDPVIDSPLVENTSSPVDARQYTASTVIDPTPPDSADPYEYEVREVAEQTDAAFDASTDVVIQQGLYAYINLGDWTTSSLPPVNLPIVIGYMTAKDVRGEPEAGVDFQFRIKGPIAEAGTGFSRNPITVTSDTNGYLELQMRPGTIYEGRRGIGSGSSGTGGWYIFSTPDQGRFKIPAILGQPTNS